MKELRTIQVGKVLIHDVTSAEADIQITSWLSGAESQGRYVCTPNVDYVVRAQRDTMFMNAINDADLRVPDGKWIVYASRIAGRPIRATVTGRLLNSAVRRDLSGPRSGNGPHGRGARRRCRGGKQTDPGASRACDQPRRSRRR